MDNTLKIITDVLVEKKAYDVMSIDLAGKTTIADSFVIASGRSVTQTKALYEYVKAKCEENNLEVRASEGYSVARWIILDVDGVMVHIFYYEDREFYDIERLWVDGDNSKRYS